MVSSDGGQHPVWASDGRALYFRAPDGAVMQVPVALSPTFSAATPARVLEPGYFLGGPGRSYDVAPDGDRFLMIKASEQADQLPGPRGIVIVLNWDQELLERVPIP